MDRALGFYTPVFRRDVLWYGDVCPSVRPSDSPSVRPGLRPPVFHTFLQHALTYWAEILHMTLFYCTTDQVRVSSIYNLRQFLLELCPFWNSEYWKYTVFRTFLLHALTYWAEIFHMTLFFLKYRSSSSVVNLRHFLWELCPFWNLEYWKYTVFRTFLLHALTYWAEFFHMTLFYCTTDQVRVSSICVNFCGSNAPFGN